MIHPRWTMADRDDKAAARRRRRRAGRTAATPSRSAELYDRYGRLVYSFAYRLTGDPTLSEECVQDVFVALWRRAADFDPTRAKLTTWLFVVARNRAIELGRQKAGDPSCGTISSRPGQRPTRPISLPSQTRPAGRRGHGGVPRGAARRPPARPISTVSHTPRSPK